MYAEAGRLDPDSAHEVALLAYREMRAAGYVAVGEFHYPHHRPDGTPYDPPNAMAEATIAAAAEAGIEHRAAHDRLRAGRRGPAADRGPAPVLRPRRRRLPAARRRPRRGASRPGRARAAQRAGVLAAWLEEIGALRRGDRDGRPHPRLRAAARDRGVPGRARPPAGRAPGRRRRAQRADDRRPRHARLRRRARPDGRRRARRSARARRPRPTSATATCPPCGIFERGIRVCIGSDSNTVIDPIQEMREIEAIARRSAERRNVLVPRRRRPARRRTCSTSAAANGAQRARPRPGRAPRDRALGRRAGAGRRRAAEHRAAALDLRWGQASASDRHSTHDRHAIVTPSPEA